MSIIYCESVQILSNPSVYNDDMQSFLSYTQSIFFLNEHGRTKYLYIFYKLSVDCSVFF